MKYVHRQVELASQQTNRLDWSFHPWMAGCPEIQDQGLLRRETWASLDTGAGTEWRGASFSGIPLGTLICDACADDAEAAGANIGGFDQG